MAGARAEPTKAAITADSLPYTTESYMNWTSSDGHIPDAVPNSAFLPGQRRPEQAVIGNFYLKICLSSWQKRTVS